MQIHCQLQTTTTINSVLKSINNLSLKIKPEQAITT